jgi:hypothetical protein
MVQSQFRRRAADCSPERRRMWSDISMSRHRRLRDKPRSRSEVARFPPFAGSGGMQRYYFTRGHLNASHPAFPGGQVRRGSASRKSSRGAISMPPYRRSLQSRLASIPGSSVGSNGLKIQTDAWAIALRASAAMLACATSTCTSPAPPSVAGSILLTSLAIASPFTRKAPRAADAIQLECQDRRATGREWPCPRARPGGATRPEAAREVPVAALRQPRDADLPLPRRCNRRMRAASCRPPDCRRHALG